MPIFFSYKRMPFADRGFETMYMVVFSKSNWHYLIFNNMQPKAISFELFEQKMLLFTLFLFILMDHWFGFRLFAKMGCLTLLHWEWKLLRNAIYHFRWRLGDKVVIAIETYFDPIQQFFSYNWWAYLKLLDQYFFI